jgi:hypothetical protein
MKDFELHVKDGYRPNLFDMDIEGFSDMKYQIRSVEYSGFTDERCGMSLSIYETEDFYVRNALDKLEGKTYTLRAYKRNGGIAYMERGIIKDVLYDGTFSWEAIDSIFHWNVDLMVEKINDKSES